MHLVGKEFKDSLPIFGAAKGRVLIQNFVVFLEKTFDQIAVATPFLSIGGLRQFFSSPGPIALTQIKCNPAE
jgi:hypothetical protein